VGGYGVSLPLCFGNFTVEPELSFYAYSQDTTNPTSPTNNNTYEYQQFTLETGVYWRQPVIPSVEMYVGGRVGYTRFEQSQTYPSIPGSSSTSAVGWAE
jgi:opacity protein-like surface antigen